MSLATIETTEYVSPAKAAELINKGADLEITAHTVRRYCLNYAKNEAKKRKGDDRVTPEIKATRFGRSWQIHLSDIEGYRANRRSRGRQVAE